MKKSGFITPLACLAILTLVGLLLPGCASGPGLPETFLDSPEHHVSNGYKLLRRERISDAQREFEIALRLIPKSSAAHRGMALLYGMKGNPEIAFDTMGLALDHAQSKEEKALVHVGYVRLYTMSRDGGWLKEAEIQFSEALSLVRDLPDAYYYMGVAYKMGYRFAESAGAFNRVLEINRDLTSEATKQLGIIEKIEQAEPDTDIGRAVAVMDWVKKADIAGLFIRELGLDGMITGSADKKQDSGSLPPDVRNHSLAEDIAKVLQLDIPGLSRLPDGTFGPEEQVTRASFAVMLSDIVVKVLKDPSLGTRFVGSPSPFRDVPEYASYFNAIMVCHTLGPLMEAGNGIFNPMGRVSGADAVLSIRRLKDKLKGR